MSLVGRGTAEFDLLSGLLTCDVCGAPCFVVGKGGYGCRNQRHGLCENAPTIRMDGIEARVFDRLRSTFGTPELKAFTKALAKSAARLSVIEAGASWESFRARWDAIGEAIAEATDRIRELEAREASGAAKAPQTAEAAWAAWATSIGNQEARLGDVSGPDPTLTRQTPRFPPCLPNVSRANGNCQPCREAGPPARATT